MGSLHLAAHGVGSITLNPHEPTPASPAPSHGTGTLHTRATPFPAAAAAGVPQPAAWAHQPGAPPLQLTAKARPGTGLYVRGTAVPALDVPGSEEQSPKSAQPLVRLWLTAQCGQWGCRHVLAVSLSRLRAALTASG
jgi:hypothetical protein